MDGLGQGYYGQSQHSQSPYTSSPGHSSPTTTTNTTTTTPSTLPPLRGAKPNRVGRACDRCRRHKIRCGAARPCIHCIRHDSECITTELEPISAKQTTANARQLQARVSRLEAVLRDFVSEGDETAVQTALTLDSAAAARQGQSAIQASPSSQPNALSTRRPSKEVKEFVADDWNPPGSRWQASPSSSLLAHHSDVDQSHDPLSRSRTLSPKEETVSSEGLPDGHMTCSLQWTSRRDDKSPPLKSDIAPPFQKQPVRYLGDASPAGLLSRLTLLDPELGGRFDPNKGYGLEDPYRFYTRRLGPNDLTVKDLPARSICEAYIDHYFNHIQKTTGYVYLHEPTFRHDLEVFWDSGTMNFQPTRSAVFLMVLANGANRIRTNTIIEPSPEEIESADPCFAWPKTHKEIGAELFDRAKMFQADMFQSASFVAIFYGLLGMQYLLQVSRSDTAWTFLGMAIREAQALGLHRKTCSWISSDLEEELRRRVWWCLYTSDRLVSFFTGRPLAIHDDDCDVELPRDYPKGFSFDESSPTASGFDGFELKLTLISLAQLMGRVLRQCYGPKVKYDEELRHEVFSLLQRLEMWHNTIPPSLKFDPDPKVTNSLEALHLEVHYYYTKVVIVRPLFRRPCASEDTYGLTKDGATKMRHELRTEGINALFEIVRIVSDLIDPQKAQSHIAIQLFTAALGFCMFCVVEPKAATSSRQREAIGKSIIWLSRSDMNTAQSGVVILRDMIRVVLDRTAAAAHHDSSPIGLAEGQGPDRSTDLPMPTGGVNPYTRQDPRRQNNSIGSQDNLLYRSDQMPQALADLAPPQQSAMAPTDYGALQVGQGGLDPRLFTPGQPTSSIPDGYPNLNFYGPGTGDLAGTVGGNATLSMSDLNMLQSGALGDMSGLGYSTGGQMTGQSQNPIMSGQDNALNDLSASGWMDIDNLGWMWFHSLEGNK